MPAQRINAPSGVSTATGTSLVTASSAATITGASLSTWGPLACLSVTFTPKSEWAANAQINVGTVAAANRPATQVGGGAAGITAGVSTGGVIYARNNTGAARTTSASTTIAFVYLLSSY